MTRIPRPRKMRVPKISSDDAKYFQRAVIWRLERGLAEGKELLWSGDEDEVAPFIRSATYWVGEVRNWSPSKAERIMRLLNRRIPDLVAKCIEEGRDFEAQLAAVFRIQFGKDAAA